MSFLVLDQSFLPDFSLYIVCHLACVNSPDLVGACSPVSLHRVSLVLLDFVRSIIFLGCSAWLKNNWQNEPKNCKLRIQSSTTVQLARKHNSLFVRLYIALLESKFASVRLRSSPFVAFNHVLVVISMTGHSA